MGSVVDNPVVLAGAGRALLGRQLPRPGARLRRRPAGLAGRGHRRDQRAADQPAPRPLEVARSSPIPEPGRRSEQRPDDGPVHGGELRDPAPPDRHPLRGAEPGHQRRPGGPRLHGLRRRAPQPAQPRSAPSGDRRGDGLRRPGARAAGRLSTPGPATGALLRSLRRRVAHLDSDRLLAPDLEAAGEWLRGGEWRRRWNRWRERWCERAPAGARRGRRPRGRGAMKGARHPAAGGRHRAAGHRRPPASGSGGDRGRGAGGER